jgi:hypothetical protein
MTGRLATGAKAVLFKVWPRYHGGGLVALASVSGDPGRVGGSSAAVVDIDALHEILT